MPAAHFELQVGKLLARKLDEALPMTLRIDDRVKRADLEKDARYAGTLLAAAAAAERAVRQAQDIPAATAAVADFLEKLERADAAVAAVHARAIAESFRAPLSP
jgi:hypothetical protein